MQRAASSDSTCSREGRAWGKTAWFPVAFVPSEPSTVTLAGGAHLMPAVRVKSEYLSKTQHELGSKRKEAETHAEGGILGLDLLKAG
jgi:hypothetical protein